MPTEKRLIDANALQRRICGAKCGCEYEDCGCEGDCQFDFFISNSTTVDTMEVVHGRWDVEVGMNYNKERICPICNKRIESNFWHYCPNCSAKMDE